MIWNRRRERDPGKIAQQLRQVRAAFERATDSTHANQHTKALLDAVEVLWSERKQQSSKAETQQADTGGAPMRWWDVNSK